MNKPQALIFDMDGVMIDSEVLWKPVELLFTQKFCPNFTKEDQIKICGMSQDSVYEYLKEHHNFKDTKEAFWDVRNDFVIQNIYKKTKLLPGVQKCLDKYYGKLPLALASSSPHEWISVVLNRFDLRKYFQVIVSADDVHGKSKPAPDIFLLTAKKLGVEPENYVVLEDSKNGILAGKAAGMTVYGFRNGFNEEQDLSAADEIFDDFHALELPGMNQNKTTSSA